MSEIEFLQSLRVVRHFTDEPISDSDLDQILETARWVGSSKNRQDWRFVVIRDREKISRLAECGDYTDPMRRAPLVIAPVGLPTSYEWDMGRVSHAIMLAASALNIGSCPQTLHRHDCARQVLSVPEDHWCRIAIALGHPDRDAEERARAKAKMRGRDPLIDLVRRETFA